MYIDEGPLSVENDSSSEEYEYQTQYEQRQHKAAKNWQKIREELLHGAVTSILIPCDTVCILCQKDEANVLCKQCGNQGYFCEPCAINLHTNINIFHAPVIQKICNCYIYVENITIQLSPYKLSVAN